MSTTQINKIFYTVECKMTNEIWRVSSRDDDKIYYYSSREEAKRIIIKDFSSLFTIEEVDSDGVSELWYFKATPIYQYISSLQLRIVPLICGDGA